MKTKTNNPKSLLPLFVFFILKRYTRKERPYRIYNIQRRLSRYPFEIDVERKALSRVVHTMEGANIGIVFTDDGIYYDSEGSVAEHTIVDKMTNSPNSLAPLHIFTILKTMTDKDSALKIPKVQEKLAAEPYNLIVERKAVGRVLHTLEDAQVGVVCSKSGAYYDSDEDVDAEICEESAF